MGFTADRPRVHLRVPRADRLDDDLFFGICQANRDCRLELLEYQENGVRLGWLILPAQRQVYTFAESGPGQCLDDPGTLSDESILPGLRLEMTGAWEEGF